MYSDKLLLLKLDDIQEGLYRLDYNLNASDSLAISKLSDMSTSLSDIQNCIVAHSQNTFLGVSWDILLPALISLGIFILGVCINILYRRKQKQEEREVVKDAIVIWAEENIPILRKYIHSIKTLADKIKKSDEILPQAFPVQQITIDVLSQFTIDRLTDSLHRGISEKNEIKGKKLNSYLSSVSYLISIQPEIRKIYDDYNSYSNKFLLEWNELWPAYQQDVALNYNRIINMPMMSSEKVYYSILTNLITVALNAIPSVNPQFSRLHNLILVIKQFDSSVVKRTPAIIKTHFLAGKVFVIAEQINAMKEYSKNFAAYANNIEASVEKFEQAVADGKLDYVVGTNLTYRQPELLTRDWYVDVDVSKYAAYFVVALNHDMSVSSIIDPIKKIEALLAKRG